MNILIYGHKGWIASYLLKYLNNKNIILGNERCDDIDKVRNEIIKYKITHVILLIGRTHGKIDDKYINTIDYLEYPGKLSENIRDN